MVILPVVRSHVHDWSGLDHVRLVVRRCTTGRTPMHDLSVTSCDSESPRKSFEHVIDLAATNVALAIMHDLYDQSYDVSATWMQFRTQSVVTRSYPGRKP